MNCPACGHENPEDATFCGECGTTVTQEASCPNCGRENLPGQKFCHGCGNRLSEATEPTPERDPRSYTPKHLAEKILQSKSALEGERKQVTVLFADVQGLDGARGAGRPRGVAPHPRPLLPDPDATACTSSRARSTSTRATASWRSSVRRSPTRITPRGPAMRRCTCGTRCGATRTSCGSIVDSTSQCGWASTRGT